MNSFLLQILVIFIPGLFWERMDTMFSLNKKPDQFDVFRRIFMFGVVSYVLEFAVFAILGREFRFPNLESQVFLTQDTFWEIFYAIIIALVSSFIWIYVTNWKLLFRFMQLVRATISNGDQSVWNTIFNYNLTLNKKKPYIRLRDFEKKIIYTGDVQLWDETETLKEIVLTNVIVYDFDARELFSAPEVYICRMSDNIDIEIPELKTER